MGKLTKREINATYTGKFAGVFACPHCGENMEVCDIKSIVCPNNHSYDFAKQGYLNFLATPMHIKYSRSLFEARKQIIADEQFFAPLTKKIVSLIDVHFPEKCTPFILDAGCGEGSHLANIKLASNKELIGVGIDISKEAILEAAKNYDDFIWTVADLVHTPFKSAQFDVILNILSPANNAEFNRLVKPDGLVIKVVPAENYLREIREFFFKDKEQETYSNIDVVDYFKRNFKPIAEHKITYTRTLPQSALASLIQMTPLAWDMTAQQAEHFSALTTAEITVDLVILVGRKQ